MGHTSKQGEYLSIFYNHSHKFGNLHSKRFFFFLSSQDHHHAPWTLVAPSFTRSRVLTRRAAASTASLLPP